MVRERKRRRVGKDEIGEGRCMVGLEEVNWGLWMVWGACYASGDVVGRQVQEYIIYINKP